MRSVRLSTVFVVLALCAPMAFVTGCTGELDELRLQNRTQQDRIDQLTADLGAARLKLERLNRQLATATESGDVTVDSLRQKIAALEEDLARKEELIKSMQERLMGVSPLPVELSTALEDFAKQHDMVEFDSERGVVKFKSDLLFDPGSDAVSSGARDAVRTLCGILNSEQAREFDIIIAGHTDDMRIARPETRAAHPTNWHLSSHRAISVRALMEENGIEPKRTSTRGFGEYRPVAPNAPGKKGNPKNRRVEIFIVPSGL